MKLLEMFPPVAEFAREKTGTIEEVTAMHSGNLGDIIYSLPTVHALGITHYVLNLCHDPGLRNRVLGERSARALVPLLLNQPTINKVTIVNTQVVWDYAAPAKLGIDYVLDAFRINWAKGDLHLIYRHSAPYGLWIDGTKPWVHLDAEARSPVQPVGPYLAVSITARYRRWERSFYEDLFFSLPADRIYYIGVEDDTMQRKNLPGSSVSFQDFRTMAAFIRDSACFIGNPSFAYAMAEGLKCNRLVELPEDNNVYPLDGTGKPLHLMSTKSARLHLLTALGLTENSTGISHPPPRIHPVIGETPKQKNKPAKVRVRWWQRWGKSSQA